MSVQAGVADTARDVPRMTFEASALPDIGNTRTAGTIKLKISTLRSANCSDDTRLKQANASDKIFPDRDPGRMDLDADPGAPRKSHTHRSDSLTRTGTRVIETTALYAESH